ncbi:PAS domain-containing sensor histidine kinase [Petrachloros mirabilis]
MSAPSASRIGVSWIVAAAAVIFVLDLLTPLGYAVPMLYVLPILLAWLAPGLWSTVLTTGCVILLTWMVHGWELWQAVNSSGTYPFPALTNRLMASALLLGTTGFLLKQKRLADIAATAKRAHQESEDRLHLFIEHAPAALAMFDRRMRYLAVSRRWREDYGLGDMPLIGRSHYEIFPEIPDRWRKVHQRGQAGETIREEEDLFERANGSVQWLRWEVRPWQLSDGQVGGIVIFTEDITEHKKAEEMLQAREELLRTVMNSLTSHIAVLDKHGAVVAVNDAWSQFAMSNNAQISPADWIGVNYFEACRNAVAHDELARQALQGLEDVRDGLRSYFEFQYPCHSPAEQRWFEMRATPLSGAPGWLVVTHEDITDRKRADEVLRDMNATLEQRMKERTAELLQANERFEWMVKATHDGVYDWDLHTNTVFFSPRWKEMHGFQASDQLESSEDWSRRIHPDDRARILGKLEDYWKKQEHEFWQEYRIARKDGTYMWVLDRAIAIWNDQGHAVRMVGAETDISWRKEAEEALRRQAQEFHALADNVPAFFAYVDSAQRYRYVNTQYEKLFGLPAEEITRMTMEELLGTESYTQVRPHLEQAFLGTTSSFDYRLNLPESGEHWFSAQYVPDRDKNGNLLGLYILLSDITSLKLSEASLRQREAQLTDLSAKLLLVQEEERRRIARELHDDFVQRLAALTIDLCALGRSDDESKTEWSSRLKQFGASAEQLATDLQHMAHQLHPSILEHVGLEAAVREYIDEFTTRTGLPTEIMVRDMPKTMPLNQATCLYRVLQESLRNVQKHANATNVLVRLLRTGHGLGLCVHDDGRGIENLDENARVKGLGLTSMEERVRQLNGTFRIRTQPGDGTEVHAWIPLENGEQ